MASIVRDCGDGSGFCVTQFSHLLLLVRSLFEVWTLRDRERRSVSVPQAAGFWCPSSWTTWRALQRSFASGTRVSRLLWRSVPSVKFDWKYYLIGHCNDVVHFHSNIANADYGSSTSKETTSICVLFCDLYEFAVDHFGRIHVVQFHGYRIILLLNGYHLCA